MKRFWSLVILSVLLGVCVMLLRGCRNMPWPLDWTGEGTLYTSFVAEIKTLDPAESYYSHEAAITDNIVEAPFGYDYLKRPYELIPVLAEAVSEPVCYDHEGARIFGDVPAERVSRMECTVTLKPGVFFQPHPCFAVDKKGANRNLALPLDDFSRYGSPQAFPYVDTRELTADDIKVGLVRLCDRRLASPIYSNFSSFLDGMEACSEAIAAEVRRQEALPANAGRNFSLHPVVVKYGQIPFRGIEVLGRYRFKLNLKRKYPQIRYWMTTHFFSPVPQEALDFYGDSRVVDAGFQMRTWPVGTGAFMMTECRLSERIVLERNPRFHDMRYPVMGEDDDWEKGLLVDAGKRLPFLDRVVFNYEREALPVWVRFQQGYYDDSGVPSDVFNSAVTLDGNGDFGLDGELRGHGVRMVKSVQATTYYVGFNMADEVVGGLTPAKRKLRQAVSIALDFHEYVETFSNGRDVSAQFIIPRGAGIKGSGDLNAFIDERDGTSGAVRRRSIDDARRLLAEAGYPDGIGQDGRPLTLYFDDTSAGSFWKERYLWMRHKLAQLGIVLESRVTDSNRLRDKISRGDWQMMMKGWVADYPDPENFLMLFYSGNGVLRNQGHGVNYTNYSSSEYDGVFKQLETMGDGPEREGLLAKARAILQEDAPCVWAFHRRDLLLVHDWLTNYKPHTMTSAYLQYRRIDGARRRQCQDAWNPPCRWPVLAVLGAVYLAGIIVIFKRGSEEG